MRHERIINSPKSTNRNFYNKRQLKRRKPTSKPKTMEYRNGKNWKDATLWSSRPDTERVSTINRFPFQEKQHFTSLRWLYNTQIFHKRDFYSISWMNECFDFLVLVTGFFTLDANSGF